MNILSVRHIDGPNVYLYKPILVARIDLQDYTERETFHYPGFSERLLECLPGLYDHHCAKGRPGGFVERLYNGTYFGHVVEHVAIELATCVGLDVHYGKTVYADAPGKYDIIMECKAYDCQKFLLDRSIQVVKTVLAGQVAQLSDVFEEAKALLAQTQLGPSTQAIMDACLRRDIPVRRIGKGSVLELGHGIYRKRIEATITEQTSAVAVDLACDKEMTKQILDEGGIPVPNGGIADSVEGAIALFHNLGAPVVLKPHNGNQGRGVSLNLTSESDIKKAYEIAAAFSSTVIVERYIEGRNIRLLVVDGKCVAASERIPAHVIGDGRQTIAELVERVNRDPLRGQGHEKPLTRIQVDAVVESTLERGGLTLTYIPGQGECVYLRESANLSTGGEARDITHTIHVSYRLLAERAARLIGLDVCGVDMVIRDIFTPADRLNVAVIEVNAAPGIRMHQHPSFGEVRDVADAIVESLFPDGQTGRIPIIAVTGTNGKTTTTRLIGHGIAMQGKQVGMTTTGGVYVGGHQIVDGDTTGPASARMILSDPTVEVAVLETARGGIVRGGLAYDKANVAVLTNISLDHVGQDGVDSIDDLVRIKSLIAECIHDDGTIVLNADDEQLLALRSRLSGRIALFSTESENSAIQRHLAMGGIAYYVNKGWIVEANGNLVWDVVQIPDVPLTMNGTAMFQVENCLAATAAMRAIGMSRQQVRAALVSFQPDVNNRGRCAIYRMPNDSHVVLDYGHNPAGFRRIGDWLKEVPHRSLLGVVGVPGDRADYVVEESGACLAEIFDAFVVKEDADKRGRKEGEVANILAKQIRNKYPNKPCAIILSEPEALRTALNSTQSGDIIVAFYEKMQQLDALVRSLGGQTVTAIHSRQLDTGLAMIR